MRCSELREVISATRRVLADSSRVEDIHRVAEITGRRRYAAIVERVRRGRGEALEEYRRLLRDRPEIDEHTVDLSALGKLAPETLGAAYAEHLRRYELELYTTETSAEFIDDPDVRYLIHRFRQTHDIWHTLVGLGVQGHEEVLLHAFTFGQVSLPVSAMIMALGGLKHMVLERRWRALRAGMWSAYRSGRRAAPLLAIRWERLWELPLAEVRSRCQIEPATAAWGVG